MYKLHYDYIKNKYDSKSKLFFIGADSLMYEIKTEDGYGEFSSNKEMFIRNIKMLNNNKCLRYSMNRIQSKDHRIGTYEIN